MIQNNVDIVLSEEAWEKKQTSISKLSTFLFGAIKFNSKFTNFLFSLGDYAVQKY